MAMSQAQDTETWRILLLGRNGSELLLFNSPAGFRLPECRVPAYQRVAPILNSEAKRLWKLETFALAPLALPSQQSEAQAWKYYVMEVCQTDGLQRFAPRSTTFSNVEERSFADRTDYAAVRCAMRVDADSSLNSERDSLPECGFFQLLCTWLQEQLRLLGTHWYGAFEQMQANAHFSLVRFQLDHGAVWFKAVGPPNSHELSITTFLAGKFPEYIPGIVATHPEWNAWLAWEARGQTLLQSAELSEWERVAAALSRIQIESTSTTDQLLAAGGANARIEKLLDNCPAFFDTATWLMSQQTTSDPAPLPPNALSEVEQGVHVALRELAELGIPDSVGHFDCSPANIVVSQDSCVFLDWAEAFVGNPFLTFQYLREYLRNQLGNDPAPDELLKSAYLKAWKPILPSPVILEACRLAPFLAAYAYAATFAAKRTPHQILSPRTARWLRGLIRRIHREMTTLHAK